MEIGIDETISKIIKIFLSNQIIYICQLNFFLSMLEKLEFEVQKSTF